MGRTQGPRQMRVVNRTLTAILLLATAPAVIGCGPAPRPRVEGKIVAVTGILPHQWLIGQIGGDHVEAIALVKPGDSAELYQPTDAEVSRLMGAAVYFCSGMPFESGPWLAALQANPRIHLVDLQAGIPLRWEGHGHGEVNDPHAWLSPPLLKVQARTIAKQLQALDPAHAEDYAANLEVLERRLNQADRSIRKTLQPLRGKAMFVFHPAWGYFAAEYGLRQVAVQAQGKEPTDRELTELQKLARQEGVKVIFVQPQFASGSPEAMARAIGGRVETLDDLAPDVIAGLLETAKKLANAYR
jgi:zinc transport system substrate-binding protein